MVQYKHVMPNNKREKFVRVLNTIQHGNRKASKYQFFGNGCKSLMTTKSHIWICQIQMCEFVCFWRWLPTTNKGGDCFQFDLFPRFGFWVMLSQIFWFYSYFNWHAPKLLDRFKCEFEVKQRKSKELEHTPSFGALWGGRRPCWSSGMGLRKMTNNYSLAWIYTKPNNKLVSA
jgi:hypothetical protein